MSLERCPFCEQPTAADAKFCSACGGALHLLPCSRCGAVNDVTATTCYQCSGPLGARRTDAPVAAVPAAEVLRPAPRRAQVLAGAAVLAAIAVLGYYGNRQSSPVDVPLPPPASSEAAAAKSDDGALTQTPAAPPPEAPLADQADQHPEESRRPNAAAGLILRPRADVAGTAGRQAPPRQEVCTDAVAALGLCTMTPEERKLAEAVAARKAAVARTEAADGGSAGRDEPPRQASCTEAIAALGLCTPTSTRKGE